MKGKLNCIILVWFMEGRTFPGTPSPSVGVRKNGFRKILRVIILTISFKDNSSFQEYLQTTYFIMKFIHFFLKSFND